MCVSCVGVYRWLRNVKELICKVLYLNKGERVNKCFCFKKINTVFGVDLN